MKIVKTKALQLIDDKIAQFQQLLDSATYENRYEDPYDSTYFGTEALLKELFSEEEVKEFRRQVYVTGFINEDGYKNNVLARGGFVNGDTPDPAYELRDYRIHINRCIAQLQVYRERLDQFGGPDEPMENTTKVGSAFVAMSFDEEDQDINTYVTGILDALKVNYQSGRRYSKETIPDKVKERILMSDVFIGVFVKRVPLRDGRYGAPPWLVSELGMAKAKGAGVIAWVEEGVEEIPALDYGREILYFTRDDITQIKKATVSFLEALREHNLI